ncbi:hypothetical protein QBC44DRAFT_382087 [Cladorrhinum sp. PSN332]|nr:hypothetical protein QBC44DRAFT_382087 [Cladorrhinum sp. PSN332]
MSTSQADAEAQLNAALSQREQKIMLYGLLTLEELPAINYPIVAQRMGMSNPRSVSNAWAVIKKKIKAFGEAGDGEASAAVRGPTTPGNGNKGRKRSVDMDSDIVSTPASTPAAKRVRKKASPTIETPSTTGATPYSTTATPGVDTPTKRGRGRPKKVVAPVPAVPTIIEEAASIVEKTAAAISEGTPIKPEDAIDSVIDDKDIAEVDALIIKQEKDLSDDNNNNTALTAKQDGEEDSSDSVYIKREPGVDSDEITGADDSVANGGADLDGLI